ncbi:MAG: hypothetical protein I8H66_00035 [Sphingobacteriia bacterium]|nr:hypothetical protein [Sphingobacteriia bacterium]
MKHLLILLLTCFSLTALAAQSLGKPPLQPEKNSPVFIAEVGCGQCQLGLPGKTCDLAIRIKGKAYFVTGTDIDSHGDAHASDGFCNAVRNARVQGKLVNNRFKASYFQLITEGASKEKAE